MSKCRFRTWTEHSDTRTESLNLYGIFLLYMVVVILKITKRKINLDLNFLFTSLVAQMVKNPSVMQGLIPGLGRSPGGGHDNSGILAWRIPMDRGAWQVAVHGAAESGTTEWLSTAQHRQRFIRYSCNLLNTEIVHQSFDCESIWNEAVCLIGGRGMNW